MLKQMFLLIIATALWGMTFPSGKVAVQDFSPLWLNSIRYLIAAFFCIPLFVHYRSFKRPLSELKKPFFAGLLLLSTLLTQTMGLQYTTVAKSSFITCLYVFMVPLIISFGGKHFRKRFWALVGLAIVGVAFLCELKFENFNKGDLLTLICVVACSFQILYLGKVANSFKSAFEFNGLQCLTIGVVAGLIALLLEGFPSLAPLFRAESLTSFSTLWALLFLAIPASLIAFTIQVHTQKTLSPHIASFIFLLESPFAVLFGFLLIGERLSWMAYLGCGLILLAVVLVSLMEYLVMKKNQSINE